MFTYIANFLLYDNQINVGANIQEDVGVHTREGNRNERPLTASDRLIPQSFFPLSYCPIRQEDRIRIAAGDV
jgi:hypothetical protein